MYLEHPGPKSYPTLHTKPNTGRRSHLNTKSPGGSVGKHLPELEVGKRVSRQETKTKTTLKTNKQTPCQSQKCKLAN